jgi:hypothetical protein
MVRSRCVLVFVAFVLTLSFAVPREDVAETHYDESEFLPYIGTRVVLSAVPEPVVEVSVVSSAVPECVAEAPAVRPRAPRFRLGSLTRPGAQPLDRRTGWAYPVSDSLAILDHSLRC